MSEQVAPPKRSKMGLRTLVVNEVIHETPDTVTLKMTPTEPADYKAGMFGSIDPHQFPELATWVKYLEKVKGGRKEARRCYSLSSAPHEAQVSITVKMEPYDPEHDAYPPLFGPFAYYGIRPGKVIKMLGYNGSYVLSDEIKNRTSHLVHICAGSGIVPNFSIIKEDLIKGEHRHTLLYGNKSWDETIFRSELMELKLKYPGRLNVVFSLSREDKAEARGEGVVQGRISEALVRSHVSDLDSAQFFVCGPDITPRERRDARKRGETLAPRFMGCVLSMLEGMGIEKSQISKESW